MKPKLVLKKSYYSQPTYEFNLPSGWTCPFAIECLTLADRHTGKQTSGRFRKFRCYACQAERFPAVRNLRWNNYDSLAKKDKDEMHMLLGQMIDDDVQRVRIHSSGDFFSLDYFRAWLDVCEDNPQVEFWAFTKSIPFWSLNKDNIPDNLILTASYGGRFDDLIIRDRLKSARVYMTRQEAVFSGLPIDTNDDLARKPIADFALVDNFAKVVR